MIKIFQTKSIRGQAGNMYSTTIHVLKFYRNVWRVCDRSMGGVPTKNKRECFIKEGQDPCQPHQVGDRGLTWWQDNIPLVKLLIHLSSSYWRKNYLIDLILYGWNWTINIQFSNHAEFKLSQWKESWSYKAHPNIKSSSTSTLSYIIIILN